MRCEASPPRESRRPHSGNLGNLRLSFSFSVIQRVAR
jgi:hypothetical protein